MSRPRSPRARPDKLSGGEPDSEERGVELLRDIKAVFDSHDREAITTKKLISELCADEERPWATYDKGGHITPRQLGNVLRPFVITSENVQRSETGERQAKGYRRSRFTEAFERYLPAVGLDDTSQTSSRPDADGMGINRDFSIRPESILDGCEKCEKPANDGDADAWTDEKSKPDHAGQSGSLNGGSRPFRTDVEDAYAELAARKAESTSDCVCPLTVTPSRAPQSISDDLSIPGFLRRHQSDE